MPERRVPTQNLVAPSHSPPHVDGEDAVVLQGSSETDYLSDFFGSLSEGEATAAYGGSKGSSGESGNLDVSSFGWAEEDRSDFPVDDGVGVSYEGIGETDQRRKKKRRRTSEIHNFTERLRREKIKERLKELQDLIPNSRKLDRASLLDEAISYMKSLQLQLQIMSGTSSLFQVPLLSAAAMQNLQMPQFSAFRTFGMNYGMRVANLGSAVHCPMLTFPSLASSFLPMSVPGLGPAPCSHPPLPMQQEAAFPSVFGPGVPAELLQSQPLYSSNQANNGDQPRERTL